MNNKSLNERIHDIDWTIYLEPEYYDSTKMSYNPDRVIKALIALMHFKESSNGIDLDSEVRFAIGNDHRGTYYPVAFEAIDFIIEVEKYSDNESTRKCALAVLNDLH